VTQLQRTLETRVRQRFGRLSGRHAIALDVGGERYGVAEDVLFPAASVIKLPLLVLALRAAEQRALDLDERVPIEPQHRASGSGVLQDLDLGLAPTWRDLLTLMIVVSDNLATNLVLERLGVLAVNGALPALGMPSSRIEGPLQVDAARQTARQRAGHGAATTAADVLRLLVALDEGTVLGAEATEWARSRLRKQRYREAIPRFITGEAGAEGGLVVGSKGGWLARARHDAGLIWRADGSRLAALVVLTADHPDTRARIDHPATVATARFARDVAQLALAHDHPAL
jgi:beta-lactamase class A